MVLLEDYVQQGVTAQQDLRGLNLANQDFTQIMRGPNQRMIANLVIQGNI